MGHIAYIGIGSNLGDKLHHCEKAITEILKIDRHKLLAKSSFYQTRPMGYAAQADFINGVVKIETGLDPLDLHRSLKAVELRLGRKETFPWGPRVIDLDLLMYDDRRIDSEELRVPHPRFHKRQFVLAPLVEIDRDLVHPVLKKTAGELLQEIREDQGVEKL